jgi:hypothetical protein
MLRGGLLPHAFDKPVHSPDQNGDWTEAESAEIPEVEEV